MNSNKITSLATPTADADAATKGYTDAASDITVVYTFWGFADCPGTGWTEIYDGYITVVLGDYDYGGGGVQCIDDAALGDESNYYMYLMWGDALSKRGDPHWCVVCEK